MSSGHRAGFTPPAASTTNGAVAKLAPIRDEMLRLLADRSAIDAILRDGAEKAATLAAPMLRRTQEAMGLLV